MYAIVTDSCSDTSPEVFGRFDNMEVVPLSYTIGGETKPALFNAPELVKEYYDRLRAGEVGTTSQVTPDQFALVFEKYIQKGMDLLVILFSAAMSGTYNSACVAREMVLEEHPDAKITVIDSMCACAGQGLLVYEALRNRDAGMSMDENAVWVREHFANIAHWFTVDDLKYLQRGGRCKPSEAFLASVLNIKPILRVKANGTLEAVQKVRGRAQSLKTIAAKFGEENGDLSHPVFIAHSDCVDAAKQLADLLIKQYCVKQENIYFSGVGPIVGSHLGPGSIFLGFFGNKRS